MKSLASSQRWLRRMIKEPTEHSGTHASRLKIYSDAHSIRLQEALSMDCPAVRWAIGEKVFETIISEFTRCYPSRHFSITQAGEPLSAFLSGHPISEDFPFLPDLAKLEWLLLESFYSDSKPALKRETLVAAKLEVWDQASIALDPTVRLLRSDWPVLTIHKAAISDCAIQGPVHRRRTQVLIHRPGALPLTKALNRHQYDLLIGLQQGNSLGAVFEKVLQDQSPEIQSKLASWFNQWTTDGILCEINLS